jgi:hypothetical protein
MESEDNSVRNRVNFRGGGSQPFQGENLQTYNLQTYKTIFQMVHKRLKNSIKNIIYYNI